MTEFIAFFAVLKALGFDLAKIIEICFIIFVVFTGILILVFLIWKYVRKPIQDFVNGLNDSVKEALDVSKASAKTSGELNTTLKEYMIKNDERLLQGHTQFEENSREIKALSKQIAMFAEHIRFLYTRAQLEPPKMGGHDEQQKQSKED